MTLWQLEHLYRKPFLKRLKAMKRQLDDTRAGLSQRDKPKVTDISDKDRFAASAVVQFGGTLDRWRAEWERGKQRRAEWDAEVKRGDITGT